MNSTIKIKKYSGEWVDFDMQKLIQSLQNAKASESCIEEICEEVKNKIHNGMSTRHIYQMAYKILNRKTKGGASRYKLKRAIMELGPTGYPFENFVGAIFNEEGYKTEVGVILDGKCVKHELDVVLHKNNMYDLIECKYHNSQRKVNDVKIPLYIQSRFIDVQSNPNLYLNQEMKYKQGWIFTNTRFSLDAISFAKCVGLQLVSWDYPKKGSLKDRINEFKLFPITTLTTLTKAEKKMLLDKGIVLCREIYKNPKLLQEIGLANSKQKKVFANITSLMDQDNPNS